MGWRLFGRVGDAPGVSPFDDNVRYQSGRPPFQPNAGMPLREEIAIVLHLSVQEAVLVITTGKGHICYALRREVETLLLGAHSALV